MLGKCYTFSARFFKESPSVIEFFHRLIEIMGQKKMSKFTSNLGAGLDQLVSQLQPNSKLDLTFWGESGSETISHWKNFISIHGCHEIGQEQALKIMLPFIIVPNLFCAMLDNSDYILYQNDMGPDEAILDRLDGISGYEEDYFVPEICESEIYSDGLKNPPFPILWRNSEWEYDISQNPGYWDKHEEYTEEIAAHMWLGRKFFELTGASRETVLATDWLEITELENGVLELVAWPHPFNSDQGEQRSRQFALRNLLFPDAVAARRELNINQRERLRDLLEEMAENPEAKKSEVLIRHIEGLSPDKNPMETVFDSNKFKNKGSVLSIC